MNTKHEADALNARLLASAPDMLAALQIMLDEFSLQKDCHCDCTEDGVHACYFHRVERDLRRAIAKAIGDAK